MRAYVAIALVACSPTIAPGGYECGPNADCPPGLTCSGSDFACDDPVTVEPFSCTAGSNATLATATPIMMLGCVSETVSLPSCLGLGDTDAWFSFTTPTNCTAVAVRANVTFPYAFEGIGVVLGDATGTPIANDVDCTTAGASSATSCFEVTLADGSAYTLDVVPENGGNCDGDCSYNQFLLAVQLLTPQ
ncbi:MAG TPA: hypothetical protein VGG28_19610 [Kofleriaceae bacterium]|jgi:hypothetical protein